MGSAGVRALHLRDDPPPWIVEDVLAEKLLGARVLAQIEASLSAWSPEVVGAFRVWHAMRARVAEDLAIDGLSEGRRDYVILGAGADTFAWRHSRAPDFAIWELDHPDTQGWKRAKLARAGLVEPANVRFVSVDLAATPLATITLPERATWNWLGVTYYLERAATESTLRAIAATGSGTAAAVEFGLTSPHCDELGLALRKQARVGAESLGEPQIAFYEPDDIRELMRTAGFTSIELLDASTLAGRYLNDRQDLRLPGGYVIAVASV